MHRADLHAELRRVAEQHVKINLGADVVDVDVDEGTMTFADGTVIHKDLIVVSDGVHVSRVSLLTGGGFFCPD
jgi:2-polyprenyl-6-methoxyphenol hydroxylase-like FAD-dependent oxidoreductase